MSLDQILLIDAQTTGMRPPKAHLLELAWGTTDKEITSRLVALPEGDEHPPSRQRNHRPVCGRARRRWQPPPISPASCARLWAASALVIHYATFEKPFCTV